MSGLAVRNGRHSATQADVAVCSLDPRERQSSRLANDACRVLAVTGSVILPDAFLLSGAAPPLAERRTLRLVAA